jgi:hypothetical protein
VHGLGHGDHVETTEEQGERIESGHLVVHVLVSVSVVLSSVVRNTVSGQVGHEESSELLINLNNTVNEVVDELLELVDKEVSEVVEGLEEILEGLGQLGEVKLHDLLGGHVLSVVESLDGSSEGRSLDVSNLLGLVPLEVEAGGGGVHLTEVLDEARVLMELLLGGVASVILLEDVEDVEDGTENVDRVLNNSLLEALTEQASLLVVRAPDLLVVHLLVDLAGVLVLEDEIDDLSGDGVVLLKGNRKRIFLPGLDEVLDLLERAVHPLAEALIRHNVTALLIVALSPGLNGSLSE